MLFFHAYSLLQVDAAGINLDYIHAGGDIPCHVLVLSIGFVGKTKSGI